MMDFLESQREWVVKTLHKQHKRRSELLQDPQVGLAPVLFLGTPLPVQVHRTHLKSGTVQVAVREGMLVVEMGTEQPASDGTSLPAVHAHVQQWLKATAKQTLPPRARQIAHEQGFVFSRLFIRSQTTKWGTCSTKGNISLNWKLVQCPPFVIDYLVIHELCHLLEMNHSDAYWRHVAARCPEYRKAEAWLKRYGSVVFDNYGTSSHLALREA